MENKENELFKNIQDGAANILQNNIEKPTKKGAKKKEKIEERQRKPTKKEARKKEKFEEKMMLEMLVKITDKITEQNKVLEERKNHISSIITEMRNIKETALSNEEKIINLELSVQRLRNEGSKYKIKNLAMEQSKEERIIIKQIELNKKTEEETVTEIQNSASEKLIKQEIKMCKTPCNEEKLELSKSYNRKIEEKQIQQEIKGCKSPCYKGKTKRCDNYIEKIEEKQKQQEIKVCKSTCNEVKLELSESYDGKFDKEQETIKIHNHSLMMKNEEKVSINSISTKIMNKTIKNETIKCSNNQIITTIMPDMKEEEKHKLTTFYGNDWVNFESDFGKEIDFKFEQKLEKLYTMDKDIEEPEYAMRNYKKRKRNEQEECSTLDPVTSLESRHLEVDSVGESIEDNRSKSI